MQEIYVVAGLGNPGRQYENSRHNVGFETLDCLADKLNAGRASSFGKSSVCSADLMTERGKIRILLVKPLTYMNLSGEAIREVTDYYKVDHKDHLIVICDDINLETGALRIRKKGSAGGHNGLKNIILHEGDEQFMRIRVGVGAKPSPDSDLAAHVLGHFGGQDRKVMDETEERAAEAVCCIIENGIDRAMNVFNTKREKE